MSEWRPVSEFPGLYEVSSCGLLRSVRNRRPRILKPGLNEHGYLRFQIHASDGKRYCRLVNRMVCEAFHGPPPPDRPLAAHLNGIRTDNRAENLQWCSPRENASHKVAHGTLLFGESHPQSKLTSDAVRDIRSRPPQKVGLKDLAQKYGVSWETVASIRRGKGWERIPALPKISVSVRHPNPNAWPEHVRDEMNAILNGETL